MHIVRGPVKYNTANCDARGYVTPRNGKWTARSVLNLMARIPS